MTSMPGVYIRTHQPLFQFGVYIMSELKIPGLNFVSSTISTVVNKANLRLTVGDRKAVLNKTVKEAHENRAAVREVKRLLVHQGLADPNDPNLNCQVNSLLDGIKSAKDLHSVAVALTPSTEADKEYLSKPFDEIDDYNWSK